MRDEEWSAIATPVRTVAALARIRFLALAWQRFLTGALEKPVHFVTEGCMLGAASLSAAAAQKVEYFAVSLRGVLVALKCAPGIQKQPVEPFDRRRDTDRQIERSNLLRHAFELKQLNCVFDLLHHTFRNQRLVDAIPGERSRIVPPQRLRVERNVDAWGLIRVAASAIRAAIVDQPAIAVSQLDIDVRALAAGTIVAFAVQDDVRPTPRGQPVVWPASHTSTRIPCTP
jgi:hypothetical protein